MNFGVKLRRTIVSAILSVSVSCAAPRASHHAHELESSKPAIRIQHPLRDRAPCSILKLKPRSTKLKRSGWRRQRPRAICCRKSQPWGCLVKRRGLRTTLNGTRTSDNPGAEGALGQSRQRLPGTDRRRRPRYPGSKRRGQAAGRSLLLSRLPHPAVIPTPVIA